MAAERFTDLLIIGAGPFGLATAARCLSRSLHHSIVGSPLSFWRNQMPEGMYLRLGYNWHLCPDEQLTFHAYLEDQHLEPTMPLSLQRFIDYGDWFVRRRGIQVESATITALHFDPKTKCFNASAQNGDSFSARAVLCTPGLAYFRYMPEHLADAVAPEHFFHTADFSKLDTFIGKRCLIIGGRQGAFETAALLAEHGAQSVAVVHRHETPAFSDSDLDSWVPDDLHAAEQEPGWFGRQPTARKQAILKRFWLEGRSKLEPWLGPRLRRQEVDLVPNTTVLSIETKRPGYRAHLHGPSLKTLDFDFLLFATGFRIDIERVPYLRPLTDTLAQADGFPVLTSQFESSTVPGAFFSGPIATRDFGPYLGFVPGCGLAARTIVRTLEERLAHGPDL